MSKFLFIYFILLALPISKKKKKERERERERLVLAGYPQQRRRITADPEITAVTTNTRPIAFKRIGQSCVLVDVNQRKAVGIIFESFQDSKETWQEIENFTSLREGKSCLN